MQLDQMQAVIADLQAQNKALRSDNGNRFQSVLEDRMVCVLETLGEALDISFDLGMTAQVQPLMDACTLVEEWLLSRGRI